MLKSSVLHRLLEANCIGGGANTSYVVNTLIIVSAMITQNKACKFQLCIARQCTTGTLVYSKDALFGEKKACPQAMSLLVDLRRGQLTLQAINSGITFGGIFEGNSQITENTSGRFDD